MSIGEKILNSAVVRKPLNLLSIMAQIGKSKKHYYLSPDVLSACFDSMAVGADSTSLDLGSGPCPQNPFNAATVFGADLRVNESNNVRYADLSMGVLPFEDDAFDYVTAYDLLEHIQRVVTVDGATKFPVILLINEVFRVLKPGGVFFNIQPCFPARQAFQDPTHVNIMTEQTLFLYFCEPAWARIYGYEGSFEMVKDGWLGGKYFSFLRKSAEFPIRDLEFVQQPPKTL